MKLSPHFTLSELTRSSMAVRHGIDNTPSDAAVRMLERLANEVLEPIRDAVGRPVFVTSGYRSFTINGMVGGTTNSAHMDGRAADFIVPGLELHEYSRIVRAACESLPVEKLINEYNQWMHVQIQPLGSLPRRQYLTAERGEKGTVYRQWA